MRTVSIAFVELHIPRATTYRRGLQDSRRDEHAFLEPLRRDIRHRINHEKAVSYMAYLRVVYAKRSSIFRQVGLAHMQDVGLLRCSIHSPAIAMLPYRVVLYRVSFCSG